MATFKDNNGREWEIEITVGTSIRLKSAGIIFLELAENKFTKLFALEHDHATLGAIMWVICKQQAEKVGVTQDEFYDLLHGDVLQAAWEGFFAAYANFTPDPKIRSFLKDRFESNRRVNERTAKIGKEKTERMEQLTNEQITKMESVMTDEVMKSLLDEKTEDAMVLVLKKVFEKNKQNQQQQTPSEPSSGLLAS